MGEGVELCKPHSWMFLCITLRVDLLAPLMLGRNGFNGVVLEWLPAPSSTAALPAVICTKVR